MLNDLTSQGAAIAHSLQQHGYRTRYLPGSDMIAWEVTSEEDEYWTLIAWFPPAAQWRFLPATRDKRQIELYGIVEAALQRPQ